MCSPPRALQAGRIATQHLRQCRALGMRRCRHLRHHAEGGAADLPRTAQHSFAVPIVIVPAELQNDPPQQLRTIGTGPWQMVEFVPGSFVKLKRFAKYSREYELRGHQTALAATSRPPRHGHFPHRDRTRGAACRNADRELQGAEDIPTPGPGDTEDRPEHHADSDPNWSILIAYANLLQPPTDNLYFRQGAAGGPEHGRHHGRGHGRRL